MSSTYTTSIPVTYGSLSITIVKAEGLKDKDGRLLKKFVGKSKIADVSDPYVRVALDSTKICKTTTIDDNLNPVWNESFQVSVNGRYEFLNFRVWDDDFASRDTILGFYKIPMAEVTEKEEPEEQTLVLGPLPGKKAHGTYGTLTVKISFTSHLHIQNSFAVPNTSFPLREGCRVTLFCDAHIGSSESLLEPVVVKPSVVSIDLGDDQEKHHGRGHRAISSARSLLGHSERTPPTTEWTYKRKNCWEKIYKAILHAEHFIYITGWSVDTSISLLREKPIYKNGKSPQDEKDNGMLTVGELLVRKAEEGVKVNMLLWDEFTSRTGVDAEGLMGTHDEKTSLYFKDTKVNCVLALRNGPSGSGNTIKWTHHQKTIILDSPTLTSSNEEYESAQKQKKKKEKKEKKKKGGERRVIAFVGGLDLCDGRWDTPAHPLYSTLKNHHKEDFHAVWPGITINNGPREPWHDIHSRIEGPIARDVLRNFEQRWRKQAPKNLLSQLVRLEDLPIISQEGEQVCDPNHWKSWSVQLFRSIDEYSAIMENEEKIDKSIHDAYVHHIRRAERFIFIENQYFLGSAESWNHVKGIKCRNSVPLELALRIVKAIEEGKRFCVYILLPMYPEGVPADAATQEVLYWQYQTIEMMYSRIHAALVAAEERDKEIGIIPSSIDTKRLVTDYLNFYCMGQREENPNEEDGISQDNLTVVQKEMIATLAEKRRFAIYVHSKMMIVDDDYIIVGSANINDRSLSGKRDTEIAIGAFQSTFTSETCSNRPRGDIHAFRLGLFYSHLRCANEVLLTPETVECVRFINKRSFDNWNRFVADEFVDMNEHGHLLKYPFAVSDTNGTLVSFPNGINIPDTTAPFAGAPSTVILDSLTT